MSRGRGGGAPGNFDRGGICDVDRPRPGIGGRGAAKFGVSAATLGGIVMPGGRRGGIGARSAIYLLTFYYGVFCWFS